ncbi:MAG: type II secretion system protein [Steroidobacteraceae bacterium]
MKGPRGFTLIELVITVAIVGLLATAAMPLVEITVKRGKEQELKAALREIRTAIDAYKEASGQGRVATEADASGYPPTLDALYAGVIDATSPDAKLIYFMRRLPRDPFYPDGSVAAAETWGLRSLASPPENPQPGDDVYDVHSESTGVALNGTAYRDW